MDRNINYFQEIEGSRMYYQYYVDKLLLLEKEEIINLFYKMLKETNESKKDGQVLISETTLLSIMNKLKMKGNKK